jgi:hypothetical protein
VLAPSAPAMRDAVRRAASNSRLGAALLLAPPAASMRLAGARVAFSPLGAAVLLTALATAVRLAVLRAWSSGLGAARVLAPPAPATRLAVLCIAYCGLEQPSSWQRLPPPCALQHGVPPQTACLVQPSSSHCRLPMTLLQALKLCDAAQTPRRG